MDTYKMVLRGVKGYHDGSEQIDLREFQAYVAALNLQDTVPGLQGIAYVKRLKAGKPWTMCDRCAPRATCSTASGPRVSAQSIS
jgi:CHASE1-domain containing sensor protein